MKRLLPSVAIAVALAAPASAKEFVSIAVCGTNGCHSTRDRATLRSAMQVTPHADPGPTGAFYRLRIRMGEPGHRDPPMVRSDWIPSLGLLRATGGPYAEYSLPQPQTARALRALSRGLDPFGGRAVARTGGGGSAWKLSMLAVLPAGLLFVMRRRRRSN